MVFRALAFLNSQSNSAISIKLAVDCAFEECKKQKLRGTQSFCEFISRYMYLRKQDTEIGNLLKEKGIGYLEDKP